MRAPLYFHPVGSSRIPVTSFSSLSRAGQTSIHLGRRRLFVLSWGKIFLLREKGELKKEKGRKKDGLLRNERETHFLFFLFLIGGWMGLESRERKREEASEKGDSRGAGPCGGPVSHTRDGLPPRRCTHTHTCIQRIRQVRAGAAG